MNVIKDEARISFFLEKGSSTLYFMKNKNVTVEA
jgi:hypothetical protein